MHRILEHLGDGQFVLVAVPAVADAVHRLLDNEDSEAADLAVFCGRRHVGVCLLERIEGRTVVDEGEPCGERRLADFDNQRHFRRPGELDDVAVDFVDGDYNGAVVVGTKTAFRETKFK